MWRVNTEAKWCNLLNVEKLQVNSVCIHSSGQHNTVKLDKRDFREEHRAPTLPKRKTQFNQNYAHPQVQMLLTYDCFKHAYSISTAYVVYFMTPMSVNKVGYLVILTDLEKALRKFQLIRLISVLL